MHYPVWINSHGSPEKRARMLALPSITLLIGIVSGYVIAGVADAENSGLKWFHLYGLTGCLMGSCALSHSLIPPNVVNDVDESQRRRQAASGEAHLLGERQPLLVTSRSGVASALASCVPKPLLDLCTCRLFLCIVAVGSCVSGAAGFILYFVADFGPAVTGWSKEEFNAVVVALMVGATVCGTLAGAECLTYLGGYQNYSSTLLMVLACGCGTFLSSVSIYIGSGSGSVPTIVLGFFALLFFAAVPTAALNGIAVSVVPSASHYASGLMFGGLHISKMIVPGIGGIVIDSIGLTNGFSAVIVAVGAIMMIASFFAYLELKVNREEYKCCK